MKRKAIQLAKQTLVISLPSKWVKQQGIKKGDEIDVEEREGMLNIGGIKKDIPSKVEIDISNLNESIIWRYLMSSYRKGFDQVNVKFSDPKIIRTIEKVISNLIGFEIVSQKSNECLIKDISGIKGEEFDNVLKRVFFILISMSEEFLDFIKKEELEKLGTIIRSDSQLNKFTDYALRLLKKSDTKNKEGFALYHLVVTLEKIGDMLKLSSKKIIEAKQKKIPKGFIKLSEEYFKILNCFFEFFYKFNLNKIEEIYKRRDSAQKIYKSFSDKLNEKEIYNLIIQSIYFIVDLTDDVFSLSF